MQYKILSKIDKKKFKLSFKLTMSLLIIVLIANIIGITYSRYQASANMNVESNIALFLADTGTYNGSIALDGLEPSDEPHIYQINVKNYNDLGRTDVDLTYSIKFETTTNLPLVFHVYRNDSELSNDILTVTSYRQDGDVYYKVYETENSYQFHYNINEEDIYTIVVYYPSQYKNNPDSYQGKVDLLSVIIDAEQVA